MGVLVLGEPFTVWIVAGTVLVLAGVFVVSRAKS
jgi:drug/metabolite transporter (DMT)-like permease